MDRAKKPSPKPSRMTSNMVAPFQRRAEPHIGQQLERDTLKQGHGAIVADERIGIREGAEPFS